MRTVLVGINLFLALALVGCSDDTTPIIPDRPTVYPDGPGTADQAKPTEGPKPTEVSVKKEAGGSDIKVGDTTCNPAFGAATACGGAVQGSWKYVKMCVGPDFWAPVKTACTGATISNEAATGSGTLVFTATNFTRKSTGTASSDVAIPAACATLVGGCTGIEAAIKLAVKDSTATCTAASGGCSCKITVPLKTDDTGTYTVSSNVLTANPAGGVAGLKYWICVKDNVLRYRGQPTNPAGTERDVVYVLTP